MTKVKTLYVCSACGAESPKWAGQCGDCSAWNTLSEERVFAKPATRAVMPEGVESALPSLLRLNDVSQVPTSRYSSGLSELDRVLGGGLLDGAAILLGGDPGIGKSTLLLQTVCHVATENSVLYVTGEESLQQVSGRAQRLQISGEKVQLLAETQVEKILAIAAQIRPRVLVIDSIQTVFTEMVSAAPGAVSQVRESAAQLVRFAKQTGITLFLVGHVTKEGTLAGPRVLEHMVDTVLYFESERDSRWRVIRAVKNRFGAVNELGIFAMTEQGLREVHNPSAIFLSRHEQDMPGSAVTVIWEGSRPLLVEVQALVDESHLGNPRRVTVGLDQNRLAMLLAVLHRHGGVATYDQDVFVNVVGGVRITETSADLAAIMAVLSSLRNRPLPSDVLIFGEVGLAGEIRPVHNGQERLKTASQHGFKRAIVPAGNIGKTALPGLESIPVTRLSEALSAVLAL